MSHKFITVHTVTALPLHNMNRDQSGLPKSQFDGGSSAAGSPLKR
ncbi:hypothetical protein [Nocardioides houyundeii]|nr:hypothetical protein [Nocardioides houyundeii]